jgi:DNA polymerase I
MSKNFRRVVVADFEYEVSPGDLPVPLCMVAYLLNENLQHEKTIRVWRGEFKPRLPFDIEHDLFVAYSAWAELTCFKVLGWPFPKHVFDLHTAYLAASNLLMPHEPDKKRLKSKKGLSAACRAYGIPGWESIDKEQMSKDIGEGRRRDYGQDAVFDYCEEDVKNSAKLLRALLRGTALYPPASVPHVLHWSEYSAKAIALIQARGIPIDMPLWNLAQENKAAVIGELLRRFDPSHGSEYPIYTPEGEWSYERFERWLVLTGVHAWPRLESGRLDTDGDAFRLMYHIPGTETLHALRDSVGFIAKARLPIGSDGRNRPSLFPFGTATGRNAHSKSPYNAHAGVRSFIAFPPHTIGLYLDFRTQEVGVAAALSEDRALMDAYRGGDVYYALAVLCGLTKDPDQEHWKKANPDVRQRMKQLQLGINYGMGVPSLAKGLDRHPIIASNIIERHKRTYPRFWEWRTDMVTSTMFRRRIESIFGWPLHITASPNKRTLYNFPMQANGAEMLRLAAVKLCEAGLVPSMLIHDGILFELNDDEQAEHAKEIMRGAGREICNGLEIGVEEDQRLIGGANYSDKRPTAKKMWATIMGALESVGAWKRSA